MTRVCDRRRRRRSAIVGFLLVGVGIVPITSAPEVAAAASCRPSRPAHCVGADLSRRDLRSWEFRGVDLRGANLSRADLRGVDLRDARLARANLARADLRGADLRGAGLATAALQQADLRRARLDRARFSGARAAGVDLRGAHLGTSFWTDADLTGARPRRLALPTVGVCDTTGPDGVVRPCAAPLPDGPSAVPGSPRRGSPAAVVGLTRLVIRLVQRDRLNPPVASRVYAYTGIGIAESVAPNGLALEDLGAIPAPPGVVDWPAVFAAGAPLVPRALSQVPATRLALAEFRDQELARRAARVAPARFARSVRYGRGVATHLAAWAATDGFSATRDRPYAPPTGAGKWVPTPTTFQGAQEPYWGTLRHYAAGDFSPCDPGAPPVYSTAPDSEYQGELRRVYDLSRSLTASDQAIARFWADDRGRTGTPAGHWVATANIAIGRRDLGLGAAAALHGVMGVAVGDAFITTWAVKFRENQVRPVTAIRALIDPAWAPYLNTPPFPDWISGHATVSGAAAAVLTGMVGSMHYRDPGFSTGSDVRAAFSIRPRRYSSFTAAAQEAARSREFAGIHYASSDTAGLETGSCIAAVALAARAGSAG